VLQLLTDINAGPSDGIVLDTLHFKKGQTVTIAGRADKMEQMWKFQTGLMDQKGIEDVEITNQTADAKTKKIRFAMTFHYKGYTKKEAAL
jgi:Tfp pilus assembly protein PilN